MRPLGTWSAPVRGLIAAGLVVLMLAAGLALVQVAMRTFGSTTTDAAPTPITDYVGETILAAPTALPAFTLTNQQGEPATDALLRGQPTLLYFGYTQCPDMCPLTLAEFARVKRALGTEGARVQYMMVSVDGERDTPEVLAAYMRRFDPTFIGLTGTTAQAAPLTDALGIQAIRRDEGSAAGYVLDHTINTYLVDAQGRVVRVYAFGTPIEVIANGVRAVLAVDQA